MIPRPVSNPPNPWSTAEVVYLEEPPPDARLTVYEDHTKEILARNDSPDLGFTWSVNPYRGCFHACAYCLAGDTPVLMGDGSTKPLREVRVRDVIIGTSARGRFRRYTRTQVLAHWRTRKPAFRITLTDGTKLVASGDHRFLTDRGWRHVARGHGGRSHLGVGSRLLGVGAFVSGPTETLSYREGYLCGLARRSAQTRAQVVVELGPLQRARSYLAEIGIGVGDLEIGRAHV